VGGHLPGVESRVRFEALYRAHAGAVLAYARRRTDAAAADDVVADVFLTVWRRLADVPSDPLPWLLGIARRILANRRRSEARTAALHDRLASTAPSQASDDRRSGSLDEKVEDALRALSDRDREILLLVAWDGLEPARAARALGVRSGAFAVRLHRARRRLAKLLAEPDADDSEKRPSAAEVS
jgi:RNA polymerase sigma-70 factor, ECF subfamily